MMPDSATVEAGRRLYEADVARRPRYPNGAPRATWEQIGDIARGSWIIAARLAVTGPEARP